MFEKSRLKFSGERLVVWGISSSVPFLQATSIPRFKTWQIKSMRGGSKDPGSNTTERCTFFLI